MTCLRDLVKKFQSNGNSTLYWKILEILQCYKKIDVLLVNIFNEHFLVSYDGGAAGVKHLVQYLRC